MASALHGGILDEDHGLGLQSDLIQKALGLYGVGAAVGRDGFDKDFLGRDLVTANHQVLENIGLRAVLAFDALLFQVCPE